MYKRIRTSAQVKLKLKKKYSETRKNLRENRIKGWWRIARINKARDIARKLAKLKFQSIQQVMPSTVTFGEIIRTEPSLIIVDGKFINLSRTNNKYTLIPIDLPERVFTKEEINTLVSEDPRRKLYEPSKRVIKWQDYVKKN